MRALGVGLVLTLVVAGNEALAAQQLVATKTILVKNPPSGARKVLWKVKETAATVMGNPITQGGATLHVQLNPGPDQCVSMPASGWSAIGSIGFKYKDMTLANGPVKVASIKKTPSGNFLLKALLKNGGPTSITVVPANPSTSYATNFTLGVGDEYCGGTVSASPNPNNATTFKVSDDGPPASCISTCTVPAVCGNGMIEGIEQCDDSNTSPGDGCDAICQVEETNSQSVGAGGTVSTGTTPTEADPLETSVTTPNAGTVTIFESSPGSAPAGFEFRGQASVITAPDATTSDNPLELIFRIDASQIRAGETEQTVQVFRSGVLVGPCLGAPGTAVPEPCVGERTLLPGGDILLRVFATHTSPWSFGYPLCGNGVLDGGETCDPPAGGCGVGNTCKADCTCAPACNCCALPPTAISILHGAAGGDCGDVLQASGAPAFNLTCNTVYFGGGGASIPPFPFPDGGLVLKVTACDSTDERLTLGPTTSVETGANDICSSAGCNFGGPAAVPNPASPPTSTCVVPTISQDVSGVMSCGGVINQIGLPLTAEIFLTGDANTDPGNTIAGIQPCPLCSSGTCIGGPNNGMACTTANSGSVGAGYPTSIDCPPAASASIGTIPIGATLTTGQVTWTGTPATNDTGSTVSVQSRVFVGYCRDMDLPGGTLAFENPPHQCWENGAPVGTACAGFFESCEQRTNGAFGPNGGLNRTITQVGSAPGCLNDFLPHASRVVGPFRLPPTFSPTIDAAADFPGPGTISLDGNMQLQ
jgi:cysteine-rich repeat protein